MKIKKSCTSFVALLTMAAITLIANGVEKMTPGEWISVSKATNQMGVKSYGNGSIIGNCDEGDWIAFGPLDLADGLVDRVEIELASPNTTGSINVHLDSPKGSEVGSVEIKETGDYNTYAVLQGNSEQLAGTHTIVLVLKGGQNLCNIKSFRFLKPNQKSSANLLAPLGPASDSALEDEVKKLLAENSKAIQANRMVEITLLTPPGASVEVQQRRHHFEFGTAINHNGFMPNKNMNAADQEQYKKTILANFNSVVHENAMKWYSNEREPGKQTFEAADKMLEWAEENGLFTRGHCVYWERDNLVPKWQKEMDNKSLHKKLEERAKIYMTRYKGRIKEHDINNEMVHCTYYKQRLGGEIWKQMFDWCHQYDPNAILYVNDYSILSGKDTKKYISQIDGFLKSGMKVGGIGVQGHFGGKVDGKSVKKKLDQLAQFNLPIKVTEFDANTKDEAAKTKALATLYVTAFAHPAVEGIYMWGFWKKQHWRPNAGLWNADWTETPAAKVYRDLVFNQWWTNEKVTADNDGKCKVRVFFGNHTVTVNGEKRQFDILPTDKNIVIDCSSKTSENWIKRK